MHISMVNNGNRLRLISTLYGKNSMIKLPVVSGNFVGFHLAALLALTKLIAYFIYEQSTIYARRRFQCKNTDFLGAWMKISSNPH
jgi:hypothetical protein